jgi:two-component system nitrogen regulation sensor histidine kinase GlnL
MVSGSADGAGLGLSIAQSMVARHGGLIEFESEPGRTVFMVYLPVE